MGSQKKRGLRGLSLRENDNSNTASVRGGGKFFNLGKTYQKEEQKLPNNLKGKKKEGGLKEGEPLSLFWGKFKVVGPLSPQKRGSLWGDLLDFLASEEDSGGINCEEGEVLGGARPSEKKKLTKPKMPIP